MSENTPEVMTEEPAVETEKVENTEVAETETAIEETGSEKPKKKKKKKLIIRILAKLAGVDLSKQKESSEKKTGEAPKKKENKTKPKDAKKTFKRLMSYLKDSKGLLVLVGVLVVFYAVVMVGSTAINEPVVNLCKEALNVATRPERSQYLLKIGIWLGLMIGLSAVAAGASYVYQRIMLKVSQHTMMVMRKQLFDHIETLPIKYFDTNKRGDIMSRFTSDISTVNDIINNGLTTLISSGITLVGTVAMMLYYSPTITLILFASVIVMVIFVAVIGALSARQFKKFRKAMGASTAHVEEYIRGQRVVKVFGHEEQNKKDYAVLAHQIRKVGIGANTISGLLLPIMNFIAQINYSICAILGVGMIIKNPNRMNIGRLVAFLSYAKSFTSPVTSLASQFTSLMSALAGAERIFEILDMDPELDEGSVKMVKAVVDENGQYIECDDYNAVLCWKIPIRENEFIYTEINGDVKFDDVSFGYNEDKVVLKHISLEAKPNEKIAFVGSTGAGKTTITNLINRFYDINEGTITVDGIDIRKIEKDSLRHSLSMVLQDTHLFTGTIADNIRYGRLDATDEEVVEAAKIANADSFIRKLPEGYNTEITGDGKNLSQGERQLLSIARAAVANPEILILDEATSSIDTRTEKLIEKGMDRLMENRTVFVIAHRLSTVRNSDKIMVLENGEVIESGNHDELLASEGKYFQLYNGLYELD